MSDLPKGFKLVGSDDLLQRHVEAFEREYTDTPAVIDTYNKAYLRLGKGVSGKASLNRVVIEAAREAGIESGRDNVGEMRPAEVARIADDVRERVETMRTNHAYNAFEQAGWVVEAPKTVEQSHKEAVMEACNLLYIEVTTVPENLS